MSWQDEVDELRYRLKQAKQMGGPAGVARQRKRGKLTVRERIDALADPGTFREFMGLVGESRYDGDALVSFLPKAEVDGYAAIGGRKVVVTASDFTVRGGSGGLDGGVGAEQFPNERALAERLPYVRLLDASGGTVERFEELGRTYLPDGNIWSQVDVKLLNAVPVVSAALGSVAGLPAINTCLAHWSVMVKDMAQVFPGGPPVVKAALGVDVEKEALGGWEIHTQHSGVINNVAEDEADCYDQIRSFLSYLPPSVWEPAPRATPREPGDPDTADLIALVPRNPRQAFDVRRLIELTVDADSFFEISCHFGRSRVTGFARINGYPVGLMANNPSVLGGATDVAAGQKAIALIRLCDTFHLPLISFADEPGFMVGVDSERAGIERAGARLICATCDSQMPWLTVVIRRLYGVAGGCQQRPTGMFRRFAWPSARWGSMHIQGGAAAAFRREIEAADDPAAKQREIEARLERLASPFRTAEATGQDIIDPRDTRRLLVEFVEDAQRILHTQLGPPAIPFRP